MPFASNPVRLVIRAGLITFSQFSNVNEDNKAQMFCVLTFLLRFKIVSIYLTLFIFAHNAHEPLFLKNSIL